MNDEVVFKKPSEQSVAIALELSNLWWNERKISFNFSHKDEYLLAMVIENKALPHGT